MRLVIRPIGPWQGKATPDPEPARFTADWDDTLELLGREVAWLAPTPRHDAEVVLEIAAAGQDLRLDGQLRKNAAITAHGVVVSFESVHGPMRYQCDRFRTGHWTGSGSNAKRTPGWQANVRAIALGLEALRKIDRYGIAGSGEQYRGWAQLGAGRPMGAPDEAMTVEQAARYISVGVSAGEAGTWVGPTGVITGWQREGARWFKVCAKVLHPDLGGDPAAYRRLVAARDLLNEHTR
jgi:hypothetical protein